MKCSELIGDMSWKRLPIRGSLPSLFHRFNHASGTCFLHRDPVSQRSDLHAGLGVYPDAVALRAVPQVTAIPAAGNVTFSYDGSSITLPNCVTDSARIVFHPRARNPSVTGDSRSSRAMEVCSSNLRRIQHHASGNSDHRKEAESSSTRTAAASGNGRSNS